MEHKLVGLDKVVADYMKEQEENPWYLKDGWRKLIEKYAPLTEDYAFGTPPEVTEDVDYELVEPKQLPEKTE